MDGLTVEPLPLREVHLALWRATLEKLAPLTERINRETSAAVRQIAVDLGVPEADLGRARLDMEKLVVVLEPVKEADRG